MPALLVPGEEACERAGLARAAMSAREIGMAARAHRRRRGGLRANSGTDGIDRQLAIARTHARA